VTTAGRNSSGGCLFVHCFFKINEQELAVFTDGHGETKDHGAAHNGLDIYSILDMLGGGMGLAI
jgi:hypothetical protein